MPISETLDDELWDSSEAAASGEPAPGLVLIFSGDKPAFGLIPLENGAIEIGRGEIAGVHIDDKRMSRAHARIAFDGRRFSVRDLGSRNGTAVDGEVLQGERAGEALRLVRASSSLFLLAADTRPFQLGLSRAGGAVVGPSLQRALKAVARAARSGRVVHVTGESGSGKELAARAFHEAGPARSGPFIAVSCATLPESLAERLLFGARKGAYSGAVDAPGYLQSAHGGTLFLDEVAELDAGVQAKLLRAIEAREIVPLGATQAERVDFRLCSATHEDLRERVARGQMRADLFFRVGAPAVSLPPLRDRPEEIPWLIDIALRQVSEAVADRGPAASRIAPHVSFVEACLLRGWPGNVRELLAEARQAAQLAAEEGDVVLARHLAARAGMGVAPPKEPVGAAPGRAPERASHPRPGPNQEREQASEPRPAPEKPSDAAIEEALREAGGNVSRAATALGMHRTQLYRWMAKRGGRAEKA